MFLKKTYGLILRIFTILLGIDTAKYFDTKLRFKRKLNLRKPKTLADKVSYIELHKQSELASLCTDKWEVRSYVANKGLQDILVPVVGGVWNCVEEIDFNKLPSSYVIKATHGCKMNYIVQNKDKLDTIKCKKTLNKWLKTTYGTYSLEPHYFSITHRLYAEAYIEELDGLIDYKFHCIHGEPEFVLVCSDRIHNGNKGTSVKLDLFDMEWKPISGLRPYGKEVLGNGDIVRPLLFEKMKEIAMELAKDFPFVRVDLYQIQDKILFGELTFSPACCIFPYFSDKFIENYGAKLNLNLDY